ncbi:MAG: class I SAM-dependent methyltransferase [Bacteroidota bacterium]
MTREVATNLIRKAVQPAESWVDLGAGSGTFSYALAELVGSNGHIWAVDKHPSLSSRSSSLDFAPITVIKGDFTEKLELPLLDGILMANALHYVRQQEKFLRHILYYVDKGGKFILIEYDRKIPNPWIPFPISRKKGRRLFQQLGLNPIEIGSTPSQYGNGEIYALWGKKSSKGI